MANRLDVYGFLFEEPDGNFLRDTGVRQYLRSEGIDPDAIGSIDNVPHAVQLAALDAATDEMARTTIPERANGITLVEDGAWARASAGVRFKAMLIELARSAHQRAYDATEGLMQGKLLAEAQVYERVADMIGSMQAR
jgi:hypothetical protein